MSERKSTDGAGLPIDLEEMIRQARSNAPPASPSEDGRTESDRAEAFNAAVEGLADYDFDAWRRLREFERRQPATIDLE